MTATEGGKHAESPCRAREVFARVGDKWSVSVMHLLGNGTMRFTELRRGVDGISQRMLTVTLRGLERDGIISRTMYPVIPPRVDYSLTPMGRTLSTTITNLVDWADDHVDDIVRARAAYDLRSRDTADTADADTAAKGSDLKGWEAEAR